MVTADLAARTARLRTIAERTARQQALLVPWQQLESAAAAYVEWHALILWSRAITDTIKQVPEVVRSTFDARCPGFWQSRERSRKGAKTFDWHALEDWILAQRFADPMRLGWFDALMYYAYKNLRTEQAWTLWEQTKTKWSHNRPSRWPTFEEWNRDISGIRALSQPSSEKSRAVEALAKVDSARLGRAVSDLIDSRAFALWVASSAELHHPLEEQVRTEIRHRCRAFMTAIPATRDAFLCYRLVRKLDADRRAAARREGWYPALRYYVVYHPRYHRLTHYYQHERAKRLHTPSSSPSFSTWLSAADAYFALPNA